VRFGRPAGSAPGLAARAQELGLEAVSGGEGREMLLRLGGGAGRARALAALGVPERAVDLAAEAADPVLAAKADTLGLVKALRRRTDVATADPNYVLHPTRAPNDEHYAKQWHYPFINLPAAWDVTIGAPPSGDVVVAVIDTGVYLAHPDLAPKLVAGYDFVSSPSMSNDGDGIDPNPDDPGDDAVIQSASFHGTHVAGTVGAATDNTAGVAGVSWAAKIMPVRVLGIGGGTSADTIQGLRFAAGLANDSNTVPPKPADVINLSLGCSNCFSATEQAVIDEVRAAGVIVVAAAGNDGTAVLGYPASYAGVVSVSAVDRNGNKAPYSNFGSAIDVAAPGGYFTGQADAPNGIASTWVHVTPPDAFPPNERQPSYAYMAGTSMASPHVAGVVALMKARCPALEPAQLDAILSSGSMTVDKGAVGRDDIYGWGLVDASKAVAAAQSRCGAPVGTSLAASPAHLEFAPNRTTATLTLSKSGPGTLPAATAADDASWLTLASPASPDGLGTWTATVTRGNLGAGVYSATLTFTAGGSALAVPVTLQVGGTGALGDAGRVYVQVQDPDGVALGQVEAGPGASAGEYAWAVGGLVAGSYRLVAGTDLDGDGLICDPGEACGAYPTRAQPSAVDLAADRAGLDFELGFDVGLGAAAAGGAPAKEGLPLAPAAAAELR
jgi:serine protease